MLLYGIVFFGVSIAFGFAFSHGRTLRPSTVWAVFVAGLLAGPLSGLGEYLFDREFLSHSGASSATLKAAAFYLLGVGPLEEAAKFLAVFLVALRRSDFKNSSDGILLAVMAALGFAAGENVLYMMEFGPTSTVGRLFLGNLGHASFSAYWGYALGVALHENARFGIVLEGLLLASVLHGLYDFLLTLSSIGQTAALLLMGALILLLFIFIRKESGRHRMTPGRSRKAPLK